MRVQFEVPGDVVQMLEVLKQSPAFMHASPRSIFIVLVAQAHAALTQTSGHVPSGAAKPSTHLTPAKQRKAEEDVAWQKMVDRRREWAAMSPARRLETYAEYYEDFGSPVPKNTDNVTVDEEGCNPRGYTACMENILEMAMGISFEKRVATEEENEPWNATMRRLHGAR